MGCGGASDGGGACSQLRALLYRNLLMKRNNWKQLGYEICVPIVIAALLAVFNRSYTKKDLEQVAKFPAYNLTGKT